MSEPQTCLPPEVVEAEYEYIRGWRLATCRYDGRKLTGLALSGGGIRSGVFCLGVLQALAKHDTLKNFDYLSTVSGGGYIGSSLTWFTRSETPFGVGPESLPYGIDDPTQAPPKKPPGQPLLPHLRRHGSYLDPGGPLSLLAGVSVVLRGLILNLFVIWLPIITLAVAVLRALGRGFALWVPPLVVPVVVSGIFVVLAVAYSIYSGWQAIRHQDMPYKVRLEFERIAPVVLQVLGVILLLVSLPYVRRLISIEIAAQSQGVVGLLMSLAGSALGLWSRFMAKGDAAGKPPTWIGPVGAGLVIYGIGLLAYCISDLVFADGRVCPVWSWFVVLAVAAGVAVIVGYFVDLNETTLHRFYRDRLMEAFMPDIVGGRPRRRAKDANAGWLHEMCPPDNPCAPYHLICAHMVMTRIDERDVDRKWVDRWRIRGGDSFVFSPRYCGGTAVCWHETATNKTFSKLSLPTAMAASGAAVNPDAASSGVGPQRNMLFAMLMALLNIRLGIWLPNPNTYGRQEHAPSPNHFNAGVAGVLDRTSQTGQFLEITDGGNFENLGVYELLRRNVRTIVVCDATADPNSAFADLQNLLSRAEADFGVTINFPCPPLKELMPSTENGRFPLGVAFSTQPFVVGDIGYPDGWKGKIYYIKPAIFAALRLHVLGFKGAFPAFPDDSTVDQFFDEARFEAYRELGFACVDAMLKDPKVLAELQCM
jgi:hypothetical protein